MSQLRVRPLQKPIILQSLIYNHRAEYNDSSSEASFLKLSEKNSEEFIALRECTLFAEMQNRLNKLEAQSIQKIQAVQRQMKQHEGLEKRHPGLSKGLISDKKEMESLTYRKLQGYVYEMEPFQHSNFEMDENLNYIRDTHSQETSNIALRFIQPKAINSEPYGKDNFVLQKIRPNDKNNKNTPSRRSSFYSRSQASPSHLSQNRMPTQFSSKTKRKSSNSSFKQSRGTSRIYEQILSNYSTAKLLAMEKKTQ